MYNLCSTCDSGWFDFSFIHYIRCCCMFVEKKSSGWVYFSVTSQKRTINRYLPLVPVFLLLVLKARFLWVTLRRSVLLVPRLGQQTSCTFLE